LKYTDIIPVLMSCSRYEQRWGSGRSGYSYIGKCDPERLANLVNQ